MPSKLITYSDNYQRNYRYRLVAPVGKRFDPSFHPELTPKEMLQIGVFGGAYFDGVDGLIPSDLPKSWFTGVKLSPDGKKHAELNFFRINASQPLSVWRAKGWIYKDDPHGWFQWYCRYYLGRRIPDEDQRQIKRWKAIRRHIMQIKKHCMAGDLDCHRKQRQAVLHWAYDSRKM
jgi:hypothetical protein